MNERDKELALQAELMRKYNYAYSKELKEFTDLIRADAMEAATRAANESWTLLAKSLVLAEREACAKVCDEYDIAEDVNSSDTAEGIALAIRARGHT